MTFYGGGLTAFDSLGSGELAGFDGLGRPASEGGPPGGRESGPVCGDVLDESADGDGSQYLRSGGGVAVVNVRGDVAADVAVLRCELVEVGQPHDGIVRELVEGRLDENARGRRALPGSGLRGCKTTSHSGTVEGLEKPPVSAGRQGQLIIGEPNRKIAVEHPYHEVLVNDDRLATPASSVLRVGLFAAEQQISRANSVQGGLELSLEVSSGQEARQGSIRVGKSLVTSPPLTPLLQQFPTDAHPTSLPPRPPIRSH